MESRPITGRWGLSRAAANRRRKEQIPRPPRKRPTQLPQPDPTSHIISRPVGPSQSKPKLPQQRGETRNTVAGSNNRPAARRILASRRKPTDLSVVEYKIQWDTSWEPASTVKHTVLQTWKEALDAQQTFTYKSQRGGNWTVLRDSHDSENDSEDMQWEMWLAIRRSVIEEAKQDWFAGMPELDLVFASDNERIKAMRYADENNLTEPTSALAICQAAWQALLHDPMLPETGIPYGDVKVFFVAQLDPAYNDKDVATSEMYRVSLNVAKTVGLIHSAPINDLDEQAFNRSCGADESLSHWQKVTKQLIQTAPFMFKTGTWMQLFASLIMGGDAFQAELAAVGVEVQDDWCARAREYAMHMYYDQIFDDRSIHDIQETFLSLRDFFRELEPGKDADKKTHLAEMHRVEMMRTFPLLDESHGSVKHCNSLETPCSPHSGNEIVSRPTIGFDSGTSSLNQSISLIEDHNRVSPANTATSRHLAISQPTAAENPALRSTNLMHLQERDRWSLGQNKMLLQRERGKK
jgi:hypothetical protein